MPPTVSTHSTIPTSSSPCNPNESVTSSSSTTATFSIQTTATDITCATSITPPPPAPAWSTNPLPRFLSTPTTACPSSPVPATSSHLFFFQAEDGIRDSSVTGVQTCALPI